MKQNANRGRANSLSRQSKKPSGKRVKTPLPENQMRVEFHNGGKASECIITEDAYSGLVLAAFRTGQDMGHLLTEAIEVFIAPINAKPITLEPGDVVLTLDGMIREIGKALSVAIAWRNKVAVGQPTKAA